MTLNAGWHGGSTAANDGDAAGCGRVRRRALFGQLLDGAHAIAAAHGSLRRLLLRLTGLDGSLAISRPLMPQDRGGPWGRCAATHTGAFRTA
jgi:hypothetical protein